MAVNKNETTAELSKCKSKRTSLRRSVTNYLKKIETNIISDETDFNELEETLEILKQKELELNEIDSKIENLIEDLQELETELDSSQEYHEKIILWKVRGQRRINEQKRNLITNITNENDSNKLCRNEYNNCGVKLPTLSLPSFSGNIIEWVTFKDLFNASVKSNDSLSNAQKLQYLKAALKGDALRIIQSISIADHNFEIAWNLLDERFSNKREQIFANIKRFLSIPVIQTESASSVLNLVDNLNEIIRSLEILGQNVENFSDTLMLYLVLQKLDNSTKLWFERELKNNEIPTLEQLIEFLKNYARTLQNSKNTFSKTHKPGQHKVNSFVTTSVCVLCKDEHFLSKCPKFFNLSVQQRIEFVKTNRLCFNCLSNMHLIKKCKSVRTCSHCCKKHHSSLHIINQLKNQNISNFPSPKASIFIPQSEKGEAPNENVSSTVCANNYETDVGLKVNTKSDQILLCTAIISVKNSKNSFLNCRCLLDCGSQKSFISEDCVNKLGLNIKEATISVSCLGTVNTVSKGEVDLLFTSHFDETFKVSTSAFVMEKITDKIPNASLPEGFKDPFKDLLLADPFFYKSGKIDILLGVNVFFTLINDEIRKRGNLPFEIGSKLGWIISGKTTFTEDIEHVSVNNLTVNTDELIKSFWEIEQIPSSQLLTKEEKECESFFQENCSRNNDGRYTVKLPFKLNRAELGNSKSIAFRKFISLENRLLKNPKIYQQYKDFMSEYLKLNHMEEVPINEIDKENEHFYIPHHHVINESSLTTKLRVVFNASSNSTSGISLNDTLMNGPKVQDDLFTILLRFRCQNIAITSDLQKMYRQIQIHCDDRDFQKILWRDDPKKPVKSFRLCTVTYGTTPASYLATRVLKQLAIDEGSMFPKAADLLLHNFYTDDVLFGAETQNEAVELITQLCELLDKGKFQLHKWCTNDPLVLEKALKSQNTNNPSCTKIVDAKSIKVLGLKWLPTQDDFICNLTIYDDNRAPATKRTILSSVSKIFDPLGWLAPFIIAAKILIQEIWKFQLSWDDPVPEEIHKNWITYCEDMSQLKTITVPRRVLLPQADNIELHCFCDASEKAYAAVVYLRSSIGTSISVRLLTSKTRVAPLKTLSIPRLELCSAVLLVHLVQAVRNSLQIQIDAIHAWSDSMIVLSWLQSEPTRWKTFVANRVSEIQSILPAQHWNHVRSRDNPADCASRGLHPSELISHDLWWSGPQWLRSDDIPFSSPIPISEDSTQEERKQVSCLLETTADLDLPIIYNISSFVKLKRIIAWCIRFIKNSKSPQNRLTGFLTSSELRYARNIVIKTVQRQEFSAEYQLLKKKAPLKANSKILGLSPFIDEDDLIRVGGRLGNSNIAQDKKHPLLLPKNHHITNIIVAHFHESHLHAGALLLLSVIRREFWIIHARSVIRQHIWKCIKCHRLRNNLSTQIMSNLPSARVIPSRVFSNTGLDFAGPFLVKPRQGRGVRATKTYICIFVCFASKAVHIETVGDLTSESFIAGLKRFVARRGKPCNVYSDCGTNFVAANKELKRIIDVLKRKEATNQYFSNEGIKWHFNPPSAPHFGGLWEAAVKSAKLHLKRTVGEQLLTQEEFCTLIAQVEACLNSRPLCPMPDDPSEFSVLTPGHFLIGMPLTSIPEENLTDIHIPILKRWKLMQKLFQNFWKRWSSEYITNLQPRSKWKKMQPEIKINDLVIIREDNVPPLKWKLGRVVELFPSADKLIRIVNIKTVTGIIKRPIHKLSVLPVSD